MTIRKFENEQATPQRASLHVMRAALEAAGVIFIAENGEGPGVRLRKQSPAQVEAPEAALVEVAQPLATLEEEIPWRPVAEAPFDEWVSLAWIGENRPADAAEFPMVGQVTSEIEGRVWDGREYRPIEWFSHYKPLDKALLDDPRYYKTIAGPTEL